MVMGRKATAGLLVLAVIHLSNGAKNGAFSQDWMNSAIEDLKKSECELLGRCDDSPNSGPASPVSRPQSQPQFFGESNEAVDYRTNWTATLGCNSPTEVRGQPMCHGQQIFYDDFLEQKIDKYKWTQEILMPWKPDYSFVVFEDKAQNAFLKNGFLHLKPTLSTEDKIRGTYDLEDRCTGPTGGGYNDPEECKRKGQNHNILPPVISARLSTRKSLTFKYGRVDIRAKLPMGDWIIPEIWLEPKERAYGRQPFKSGRIQIAMARGNKKLKCDGIDMGNDQVEAGVYLWNGDDTPMPKLLTKKLVGGQNWGDSFHNYSIIWTQDNIEFLVDGETLGLIRSARHHPLYHTLGITDVVAKDWKTGTDMAPFDKEFYITLGVSVGGRIRGYFPDNCIGESGQKPWKNTATKALANFWERKESWKNTWKPSQTALQVDFVRVTALETSTVKSLETAT